LAWFPVANGAGTQRFRRSPVRRGGMPASSLRIGRAHETLELGLGGLVAAEIAPCPRRVGLEPFDAGPRRLGRCAESGVGAALDAVLAESAPDRHEAPYHRRRPDGALDLCQRLGVEAEQGCGAARGRRLVVKGRTQLVPERRDLTGLPCPPLLLGRVQAMRRGRVPP